MIKADFFITLTAVWFLSSGVMANDRIEINDAWINEAPPSVSVLAGYATLSNNSQQEIHLLRVTSPDFGSIEIHEGVVRDGVASMIKQDSLALGAASVVELKPGGFHLMLFQPARPLMAGDSVALELIFSDESTITKEFEVRRGKIHDHDHHH